MDTHFKSQCLQVNYKGRKELFTSCVTSIMELELDPLGIENLCNNVMAIEGVTISGEPNGEFLDRSEEPEIIPQGYLTDAIRTCQKEIAQAIRRLKMVTMTTASRESAEALGWKIRGRVRTPSNEPIPLPEHVTTYMNELDHLMNYPQRAK